MFKIVKCKTYDEKEVAKALEKLVDLSKYVKKGDRVLVKPNLLDAFPIKQRVTTDPSLVKAVLERLHKIGAKVIIGDSSQRGFNRRHLEKIYETTGMKKVADETEAELNYDTSSYVIPGTGVGKIKVMSVLEKVDKVINLCKVKVHMMAKFTCATKNLYGYVVGWNKFKHHFQMDMGKWSPILLELEKHKKPVLTIADGIIGMEKIGPFGGDPKKLGLLIAGTNVYEMDYNICKIIGLDPMEVLYLKQALEKKKFKTNNIDFKEYYVKFKPSRLFLLNKWATKEYKSYTCKKDVKE